MGKGYEFMMAATGMRALEIANSTPPDLIISDLAMPGVTGADLCEKIRLNPLLRHIPFVIVTANREDRARRNAFAAGIDGFLRKPIESSRLQFLVSELLSRRRSAANLL